jgi:hypothetical protein
MQIGHRKKRTDPKWANPLGIMVASPWEIPLFDAQRSATHDANHRPQ